MSFDLNQFHQIFFDETREHLEEMERLLLSLDLLTPDAEELNAVFRAAHSIKGGASTFGFPDMASVTHALESLLDRARHGELKLTSAMIDAALKAGDVLTQQLRGHREGFEVSPEDAQPIIECLRALTVDSSATANQSPDGGLHPPPTAERYATHIALAEGSVTTAQCEALMLEFSRLGQTQLDAPSEGGFRITLDGAPARSEIEDILSFFVSPEQCIIELTQLDAVPTSVDFAPVPANPTLEDEGFGFFVDPAQLKAQIEDTQGFGFFVDTPLGSANVQDGGTETTAPSPDPKTNLVDTPRRRASDREVDTSIRVSVEKVDQLINLVGELVITNAMLAQTLSSLDPVLHQNVFNGMGQLDRNSRDLQEAVMSIRMLPIGSVFSRFPRLVRDLAAKLGKQVEMKMVGESTELDKGLIERLADPLTHLVRNSLDHGIEMPAQREQAGKPAKGQLTLQAFHQGGSIVVEVQDDGAGLNRERILAKAHDVGIEIDDDAPDQEVWQLIFAPGFSTAAEITDVSGRGVGMDVVKRNIDGMGGRVEISSLAGQGTCITIRLPLTLAILDGMSVGVGLQVFIVPLNMIVESLQPKQSELSTVSGKGSLVHVRGEYLPVVALHEVFGIVPCTTDPCEGILVILEIQGGKAALFVDELLGQHQVVIKSLETNFRKVRGVSGATIMGDGRVALILDIAALVQLSRD